MVLKSGFRPAHKGNKREDRPTESDLNDSAIPSGSGKMVIGRQYTDADKGYADTILDEFIFWNRPLTNDEAKDIYESYSSDGNQELNI